MVEPTRWIGPLDRSSRVYVAGHGGLAGSAIWRALVDGGFRNLLGARSAEVDLRDREATHRYLADVQPDVVVLAAAKVGGIVANSTFPTEFLTENLRIQTNVMDAALALGVDRLLFLGSSCIYPKMADQPISEDSLLTGPLEPTNDAYAVAKIAGIMHVQSVRRQYGAHWVSAMPTNLYGPGDNYHPTQSHVLPGLIRRFVEAAENDAQTVTLWGTGTPMREFMHSDDLGSAIVTVLDRYDEPAPINVGTGAEVSIADLAEMIAHAIGFKGSIRQDLSKPDGTPRKLLDSSRLAQLGWTPSISLADGVTRTVREFRASQTSSGRA